MFCFMNRHVSFSVNAHTRKCEITYEQRNSMCLEWPRVQQIYKFYCEFFWFLKIAKKRDILSKKQESWIIGEKVAFPT